MITYKRRLVALNLQFKPATYLAELVAKLLNLELKGSLAVLGLADGRSNRTCK